MLPYQFSWPILNFRLQLVVMFRFRYMETSSTSLRKVLYQRHQISIYVLPTYKKVSYLSETIVLSLSPKQHGLTIQKNPSLPLQNVLPLEMSWGSRLSEPIELCVSGTALIEEDSIWKKKYHKRHLDTFLLPHLFDCFLLLMPAN